MSSVRAVIHFNSRPSARGDWRKPIYSDSSHYFNSRPSARGDRSISTEYFAGLNFNSRPSARGDANYAAIHGELYNFNSRPSARGDPQVLCGGCVLCISIHAPPRGATAWQSWRMSKHEFQFTPLREGRHFVTRHSISKARFQFTPLREGRRGDFRYDDWSWAISIHAPPRGATASRFTPFPSERFQFTPLREGRRRK